MNEIKKAGFVSIIGLPNAGKSTLMNELLETDISIVTSKPQTTRKNTKGIGLYKDSQIIFVDTPGLCNVKYKLQEFMVTQAYEALDGIDVVLFLHDISYPLNEREKEIIDVLAKKQKIYKIFVNTKTDLDGELIKTDLDIFDEVLAVSAIKKKGIKQIYERIYEHIPEHPAYYDPDLLTDENIRDLAEEIIRKHFMIHLEEELPYSIAVIIEEFDERDDSSFIRANIFAERESQKKIIIGKNGKQIKKIRLNIEEELTRFLEKNTKVQMWIKVVPKWRKKEHLMARLGYNAKKKH